MRNNIRTAQGQAWETDRITLGRASCATLALACRKRGCGCARTLFSMPVRLALLAYGHGPLGRPSGRSARLAAFLAARESL